jgi:A/G-specific adenine glycosylase
VPKPSIADALLSWHARHGRHDLPWQQDRTLYRVWVSEIMLQQTQVATVLPYYARFMARFPTVHALAAARVDEVLHLWAGLGYYARARNLHRAAAQIEAEFGGVFPVRFEQLESLPGIGRSTAGAILALARDERCAILDGNVKRVLARCFGIEGSPAERATLERLWRIAERETPRQHAATYTQAIMDLGATVCTRRQPLCAQCPLAARCVARRTRRQHELPAPRAARARPARHTFMLLAVNADGGVFLSRRPQHGIWGGLWCLPEFATQSDAAAFALAALRATPAPRALASIRHTFTHFDLTITPLLAPCAHAGVMDAEALWYNPREPAHVGLPAPVKALLERVAAGDSAGASP